jgi:tetratricopeptide (TPR) repeat protein
MQSLAKSVGVIVLTCCLALPGTVLAIGSGGGDDADAKYKQAVEAVESKDYKGAISLLKEVLESNARNADALNYMGYSYRKLGNYEWALTYYKRALAVDPDHKGANEYLGEAYLELKQPDKAKAHLDRLAKICGTSCDAYQELKKAFDAYRAKARPS